jgi:dipeptidyl aminopeptidase/acylaminoacyl peptidase
VAAFCAAATGTAIATPSMRDVLEATYALHDFGWVDLSPVGNEVAWEESFHQGLRDALPFHAVYVRSTGSKAPATRITAGNASAYYDEENPVWSPDGAHVAFLSDARSKGRMQIFVANGDGTRVSQVGKLDGEAQGLAWAPNGKAISLLYVAQARRKTGATNVGARDVGVIGSTVDEQRLTLVDISTGALREITPADEYVYEYGWSPDGSRLAVTYAHGNGDNNWWVAHLAAVDAATGAMRDLLAPSYQINDPQWSPDGKSIAVIGGLMSDFGSTGGDVYVVDAATGAARNVRPEATFSVRSLRWNDPSTLTVVAVAGGSARLMRLDASTGATASLTDRDEALGNWSSSHGGSIVAVVRNSFVEPPELWAGPPTMLRQQTAVNAGARNLHGKAVSLQWKNDGFNVQGWLVYPLDFQSGKSYPMIAIIHGGPSAISLPSFGNRTVNALTSQGYFVFMPNPRGSFGQGEAFTRANIKDFGYGDWRDDLAGVDTAIGSAPIDPKRLGLFGWSYGGYMAMWAETQTMRFKALVAGAGVVNWQSYYGQNKIDEWMIPFFGASVYQDPAVYAKSSPITFITASKTPVLILQGERDEEVPAPQAFEFWHAMETLDVPTKLIVYADEGHGPRKIVNQIDVMTQTVDWFDRYLR